LRFNMHHARASSTGSSSNDFFRSTGHGGVLCVKLWRRSRWPIWVGFSKNIQICLLSGGVCNIHKFVYLLTLYIDKFVYF
jgi:hypothetical protein